MKRFLRILAIVLVIIAIIALIVASFALADVGWAQNLMSSSFISTTLGIKSAWALLALGVAGLVLAAIMSPSGFSKAMNRVTHGLSNVAGSAAKLVGTAAAGVTGGLLSGLLGDNNWLWVLGAAGLIYLLWPSDDTLDRRHARNIEDREQERLDRELRLEERRLSAAQSGVIK